MASKTYSGQDIADAIGVEGITLRRYIRSDGTRVGRGKKYSFSADEARTIVQGFSKLSDVTLPEEYDAETGTYIDDEGNEAELTDEQQQLIEVQSLFTEPEAETEEDSDEETEDQDDDSTEDDNTEPADLSDLDDTEDEESKEDDDTDE